MPLLHTAQNSSPLSVGRAAALLAFLAAALELLAPIGTWLFDSSGTLDRLLQAHGHSMPALLAGPYTASTLTLALLFLLDLIPATLLAFTFFYAGSYFWLLAKGRAGTARDIRWIWIGGVLCISTPFAHIVVSLLQSLTLSMDLLDGQRGADIFIDLSSSTFSQLVLGLLLCAFAKLMRQAQVLSEENAKYI